MKGVYAILLELSEKFMKLLSQEFICKDDNI